MLSLILFLLLLHILIFFIFFVIFVMSWDFGQPKTFVSRKKFLASRKKFLAECVRFGRCLSLFASCGLMPRRGWTTMDVPDGWVQLISPKSEKWPLHSRQRPTPAVRPSGVQGTKEPVTPRPATDPIRRVSPDLARVTAQERARKLEKALEVMSDVEGPAVEAIRVRTEEGSERCCSPNIGRADSAVRIVHHEVRTPVGRDRRATTLPRRSR